MLERRLLTPAALAALFAVSGCAAEMQRRVDGSGSNDEANESPAPLGELLQGVPANDSLPDDSPADVAYPSSFDLLADQTPVRFQGARGVCTIFAAVAMMESQFKRDGSMSAPDFSEQYVQWLAKTQSDIDATYMASSPNTVLDVLHAHGAPVESAWPYEESPWSEANDAACVGVIESTQNLPTYCYTNGDPPASIGADSLHPFAGGHAIRSTENAIKEELAAHHTGVLMTATYFSQAWGRSNDVVTHHQPYREQGIVLYPTQADIDNDYPRQLGHSVFVVGWDDEMEVARILPNGTPELDEEGRPVMERGFFLFKNSWGTEGFGAENSVRAGYGWISYRYATEYTRVFASEH